MGDADNQRLVREIYADWERGDFTRTDWAHPEIEVVSPLPHTAPTHGLEGMRRMWADWLSGWRDFSVEAVELVQRGDCVLVLSRFEGAGRESGISAQWLPGAALFTIRGGVVVRLALFSGRDAAMADLEAQT